MPKKMPKIRMTNAEFLKAWKETLELAKHGKLPGDITGWAFFVSSLQNIFCTDELGTAHLEINQSSVRSKCYNLRKKMLDHGFVRLDIPRAGTAGAIAVDWEDLFEDAGLTETHAKHATPEERSLIPDE